MRDEGEGQTFSKENEKAKIMTANVIEKAAFRHHVEASSNMVYIDTSTRVCAACVCLSPEHDGYLNMGRAPCKLAMLPSSMLEDAENRCDPLGRGR